MFTHLSTKIFVILFILSLSYQTVISQVGSEFPIEVGVDSCYATGFAYDDTKYMIVMRKEKGLNGADIVVQFHSKTDHSLIGSPIVIGSTNVPSYDFDYSIPQAAFDGTRFLVVWSDIQNGGIKYRFIHSQTFELSQLYSDPTLPAVIGGLPAIHYNPVTNKYLLITGIKTQTGIYLVNNFIHTDGFMTNVSPLVNFAARKEVSVSYANGKYLVCFIKEANTGSDYEVYGQLLNEDGSLSGNPFLIDGSTYPSDNPLFVTFDGKYHICFFPDEEPNGWKIYAKRIVPNGSVGTERYLITEDGWLVPYAAIGNSKILVTWLRPTMIIPGYVKGKFFDMNLNGIGNEFIVFDTLNGKFPFGNGVVFGGGKFYCYTTRVNMFITPDSSFAFTNGDVYGVTIFDPTSVESESINPTEFSLYQNFPNPFNPSTEIKFHLKENARTSIIVFDLLGKEVATLINQNLDAGIHSIKFNPQNFGLGGGVYFYQLKAGNSLSTKKMLFIK